MSRLLTKREHNRILKRTGVSYGWMDKYGYPSNCSIEFIPCKKTIKIIITDEDGNSTTRYVKTGQ